MTLPSEVRSSALGRSGREEPAPASTRLERARPRTLRALRWLVVVAFVVRALLSLLDVQSVALDDSRSVPFVTSVSLFSTSLVWPVMWGGLAAVAAAALAVRIRLAWLIAVAVAVAYLVVGISDMAQAASSFATDAGRLAAAVAVELVAPLVVLGALLAIRDLYLPPEQYGRPLGRTQIRHATPPTLDRWRRH